MILLQADENVTWLAPYAYTIVLLGFGFFLFRVFENWFANSFDKPLYRHWLVYRKLNRSQLAILEAELPFYNLLDRKHKRQFGHRVATFIKNKKFIGRDELVVDERMQVLVAGVGCMLSFGRKNYLYDLISVILIYPGEFYSNINSAMHIGEFNPQGKALVLSWPHFQEGIDVSNDNRNLGIHEFMHAMQLEAKQSRDLDSTRFAKQFQNILKRLTDQSVKDQLDKTRYFREYAFTNQYEFMAVLSEYFIESPVEFKKLFPDIYDYFKRLLNFRYGNY